MKYRYVMLPAKSIPYLQHNKSGRYNISLASYTVQDAIAHFCKLLKIEPLILAMEPERFFILTLVPDDGDFGRVSDVKRLDTVDIEKE